ncbi:hypothetical protein L228DRAFT_247444 [Xylona heveae TC161]|uniref:Uncharacterized protein n=1 Tax=Xylona heveae (strain CBS 132557 / TC161) TaxID=1328760 RepID=A0A165H5A1_XYLHT|nr:hypothetical protein L228DRAFT_247444 [Xylona heveae TC161]KZF23003.1 hypothetical protein L228DRAFT_247444 [Xylona heveae TC161]
MVSAPDIITYIGVPLAVLGVLPILYTCVKVLLTAQQVKKELKVNHLAREAVIRSSTISGVIEIELPRRQIASLDRHDPGYWALSTKPSTLKGGSWSIFNWDALVTGHGLYRIQYKEELRQPQAEIDFEQLIAFLLDRGALPCVDGFRMLRTSGLWTPTGTTLLLSPDTTEAVLKTVLPDDSDGILSLAVQWKSEWGSRTAESLPPYWMRLEGGKCKGGRQWWMDGVENAPDVNGREADKEEGKAEEVKGEESKDMLEKQQQQQQPEKTTPPEQIDMSAIPIRIRVGLDGIMCAEAERSTEYQESSSHPTKHDDTNITPAQVQPLPHTSPTNNPDFSPNYIPIYHLQSFPFSSSFTLSSYSSSASTIAVSSTSNSHPRASIPASTWFASAATALTASKALHLWSYTIPDSILSFASKDSVPCGVMVLLGLMNESDTPAWSTPFEDPEVEAQRKHAKFQDWSRRVAAEGGLPPDQRADAAKKRMLDDHWAFVTEMNDRAARKREWEKRRVGEALVSPRLSVGRVAREGVRWLWGECLCSGDLGSGDVRSNDCSSASHPGGVQEGQQNEEVRNGQAQQQEQAPSIQEIVESLLHSMILDPVLTHNVTEMLNVWLHWSDSGGMNTTQWEYLIADNSADNSHNSSGVPKRQTRKKMFVLAACILALIAGDDAAGDAGGVGDVMNGGKDGDGGGNVMPSGWAASRDRSNTGFASWKSAGSTMRTMSGLSAGMLNAGGGGGGNVGMTGTKTAVRSTVSEDMREVIKSWRKVRLG